MGLFDFFKKKKTELTEEQLKLNKMWELWVDEQVDSPYAELMNYQSEINNGGTHNISSMSKIQVICEKRWRCWKMFCRQNSGRI